MRPRKVLTACFTTGSLAAIIELIAQIGLRSAKVRRMSHSNALPTKTFAAKWMPAQSPFTARSTHCVTRFDTVGSGIFRLCRMRCRPRTVLRVALLPLLLEQSHLLVLKFLRQREQH